MGMFEVWQIRLAVILILNAANWLAYLYFTYREYRKKPKYLFRSLAIPTVTTALLYSITGHSDSAVSEETGMIALISIFSMVAYLVLFALNRNPNQEETAVQNASKFKGYITTVYCVGFVLCQFTTLGAYAYNINSYAFKQKSSTVEFPNIVCHPKDIFPVLKENQLSYQIWPEYSSFSIENKPFIIEIASDGVNDNILNRARRDINRKHPRFPIFKFGCDENYQVYDNWVMIKAHSVSVIEKD